MRKLLRIKNRLEKNRWWWVSKDKGERFVYRKTVNDDLIGDCQKMHVASSGGEVGSH